MYKRIILFVLLTSTGLFALNLLSCKPASRVATENSELPSYNFDHAVETEPVYQVSGIYSGTFPGDITHTILFNDDKTYKHEQQKFADSATFRKSTGNWTETGNRIFLTQSGKKGFHIVFEKIEDTLFGVLINGVKPTDSSLYSLVKQKAAGENDHWKKEAAKGVVFVGLGNEPFWNIQIFDKKAVLNFASESKVITFSSYENEVRNDTTIYKFSNDNSKVLYVFSQFCSDGMSDYIYEYKVALDYNGEKFAGCGILLRKSFLNPED